MFHLNRAVLDADNELVHGPIMQPKPSKTMADIRRRLLALEVAYTVNDDWTTEYKDSTGMRLVSADGQRKIMFSWFDAVNTEYTMCDDCGEEQFVIRFHDESAMFAHAGT